ncbi:MAG: carboxypeptidase regulatory-like domain-containing protein [Blastocatellia bacterium]|nr:carboxypeptidase regulatory-like domain-containing protein [Blastocatellia bacterium]
MQINKIFLPLLILALLPTQTNATPKKLLILKHKRAIQTTTGTLVGTVIDEKLQPISGVLVKVINVNNGFSFGRRTSLDGTYRIDFLPAGTYDITAQADGYQPNMLSKFLVEVNREKIIKPPPIVLVPLVSPTVTNTPSYKFTSKYIPSS